MSNYRIAPSLLSANFARLGEEAQAVINAGGDILHLDVMDNHYVPNLTVGPLVCASLRNFGIKAPIDVHLMTRPVDRLIIEFAKAGATSISFHPEGSDHLDRSLDLIRKHHCQAGVVLNPATPLSFLEYIMDKLDFIIIMSVNPGFGGQQFIPKILDKLQKTKSLINESGYNIRLSVDGGVKVENIAEVAKAGADTFVVGSAIFSEKNYSEIIHRLRKKLNEV